MKFNIGDRVRLALDDTVVETYHPATQTKLVFSKGDTGTVAEFDPGDPFPIGVSMDKGGLAFFKDVELLLVEEEEMQGPQVKKIILREVIESYKSSEHYDDYESLRTILEGHIGEEAWSLNIDEILDGLMEGGTDGV